MNDLYWRAFNLFAKLFGAGSIIVGGILVLDVIVKLSLAFRSVAHEGIDLKGNILSLAVSIAVIGMGVAFLKAEPFRSSSLKK